MFGEVLAGTEIRGKWGGGRGGGNDRDPRKIGERGGGEGIPGREGGRGELYVTLAVTARMMSVFTRSSDESRVLSGLCVCVCVVFIVFLYSFFLSFFFLFFFLSFFSHSLWGSKSPKKRGHSINRSVWRGRRAEAGNRR